MLLNDTTLDIEVVVVQGTFEMRTASSFIITVFDTAKRYRHFLRQTHETNNRGFWIINYHIPKQ